MSTKIERTSAGYVDFMLDKMEQVNDASELPIMDQIRALNGLGKEVRGMLSIDLQNKKVASKTADPEKLANIKVILGEPRPEKVKIPKK